MMNTYRVREVDTFVRIIGVRDGEQTQNYSCEQIYPGRHSATRTSHRENKITRDSEGARHSATR